MQVVRGNKRFSNLWVVRIDCRGPVGKDCVVPVTPETIDGGSGVPQIEERRDDHGTPVEEVVGGRGGRKVVGGRRKRNNELGCGL